MRDYSIGGNLYDDYYSSLGGIEEIDPYGYEQPEPEPDPAMDLYEGTDPLESHEGIGFDDPGMEQDFQNWYRSKAEPWKLNPDPDAPDQQYDYRAAYLAGDEPDDTGHWPSKHKFADHPNRYVDGQDTITGELVGGDEPDALTGSLTGTEPSTRYPVSSQRTAPPDFSGKGVYNRAVADVNSAYPASYLEKDENPLITAIAAIPRLIGYIPEVGKILKGVPTYNEMADLKSGVNTSMGMEGAPPDDGPGLARWLLGKTQRQYMYESARTKALKTRLGIEDLTSKIGAREGSLYYKGTADARAAEEHPLNIEALQQGNYIRMPEFHSQQRLRGAQARSADASAGANIELRNVRQTDLGTRPVVPGSPYADKVIERRLGNEDTALGVGEKAYRSGLTGEGPEDVVTRYAPRETSPLGREIAAEVAKKEEEAVRARELNVRTDDEYLREDYRKIADSYTKVMETPTLTYAWLGGKQIDPITDQRMAQSEDFLWWKTKRGERVNGPPVQIDQPDENLFRQEVDLYLDKKLEEINEKNPSEADAIYNSHVRRIMSLWRGYQLTKQNLR